MKKIVLILSALVAGVVVFSSCKGEPKKEKPTADTFMSVAISLPNSTFTRAESEKKTIDPKVYAGTNKIDRINIFIVDENAVTNEELKETDFTVNPAAGNKVIKLTAKKAIPTKSGEKHVYVLINATDAIVKALSATPSLTGFEQKYKTAVDFSADIAKMETTGEMSKVVMANSTKTNNGVITVKPGIDENTALAGTSNKITVEVQRVAAVAIVTKVKDIKVAKSAAEESQYKVEKLTYAAGLVEAKFYLTQNLNNGDFESPNFNFKPQKADFTTKGIEGKLLVNDLETKDREVLEVMTKRDVDGIGKFTFKNKNVFLSEMSRKEYVAGNTTYILVRAFLRPSDNMFADGTKQSEYTKELGSVDADKIITDRNDVQKDYVLYQDSKGADVKVNATKIQREYTYQTNGTFWVAGDGTKEGSVYASYANSQNPAKNGVLGQKVRPYIAGKALYSVYPNPDVVADGYQGATKFPIKRNDIYHINITRFAQIGANWNDRYPAPSPGGEGEEPGKDKNPDPAPDIEDNNVEDPVNPVIPKKTYLAVDIDILPWEVYSHDIVL